MQNTIPEITGFLLKATDIVISVHLYPDGDAVGSALALCRVLRHQGKNAQVLLNKSHVGTPRILEGFNEITDITEYDFSHKPELFVSLDCADPSRICDERIRSWVGQVPTINIDHHGKELFGDANYVIIDYSSTGELIYDIIQANHWEVDRQISEALWVSIVTDTNRFSRGVRPSTLSCASHLLSMGARVSWLNDELFLQEPPNVFELRKRAFASLEIWCGGTVAIITLTPEDFAETHCTKQDTEEFPNIPLSIKGVKNAIFLYPLPGKNNEIRFSLRSRDGAKKTARTIAEYFGGAGHEHSAGAIFHGTIPEAKEAIQKYLSE